MQEAYHFIRTGLRNATGKDSLHLTQIRDSLRMQEHLNEEEHAVYRRGRNARSVSPAKNQSITDYRRATGFEALIGHLYLSEEYERLTELVTIGLEAMEEKFDTERNEGAKNAGK